MELKTRFVVPPVPKWNTVVFLQRSILANMRMVLLREKTPIRPRRRLPFCLEALIGNRAFCLE